MIGVIKSTFKGLELHIWSKHLSKWTESRINFAYWKLFLETLENFLIKIYPCKVWIGNSENKICNMLGCEMESYISKQTRS